MHRHARSCMHLYIKTHTHTHETACTYLLEHSRLHLDMLLLVDGLLHSGLSLFQAVSLMSDGLAQLLHCLLIAAHFLRNRSAWVCVHVRVYVCVHNEETF